MSVLYQRNYFIFLQEFANKKQYCGCTEGRRHLIYVIATAIGSTIPCGTKEIADLHLCIPHGCCHLVSSGPGFV